jgi:peroxiredoxin
MPPCGVPVNDPFVLETWAKDADGNDPAAAGVA